MIRDCVTTFEGFARPWPPGSVALNLGDLTVRASPARSRVPEAIAAAARGCPDAQSQGAA